MFIVFLLLITSIVGSDFILTVDEKSPIDQAIFRFPSSSDLLKNFHSTFALTNNQTELILTRTIDRDHWCAQGICSCEKCSFVLEFVSTDSRQAKFFTLNITVNDINDHTCQFLDVQQRISLSESIQVGHRFPLARAIDEDGGINGQLTFELLPNDDGHFQLDVVNLSSNEYAIYALVKRPFDREMLERYQLVLQGRDHAVPQPRSNRINLTIEILDENDNAPKFNQTEYSIQVDRSSFERTKRKRSIVRFSHFRRTRRSVVSCYVSLPVMQIKVWMVWSIIRSSILRRIPRHFHLSSIRTQVWSVFVLLWIMKRRDPIDFSFALPIPGYLNHYPRTLGCRSPSKMSTIVPWRFSSFLIDASSMTIKH